LIRLNLFYSYGFVEVDPEEIIGFTRIAEDQCRVLIGSDLENSNVLDVREEYLRLIREIGVASFDGWKTVGSEES
jgi:hypothetical protein